LAYLKRKKTVSVIAVIEADLEDGCSQIHNLSLKAPLSS